MVCKVIFMSNPTVVLRLGWGFDNKEYEVPVEETRRCVKNADASVYCDPEKDCHEKSLKSDWTNLKL